MAHTLTHYSSSCSWHPNPKAHQYLGKGGRPGGLSTLLCLWWSLIWICVLVCTCLCEHELYTCTFMNVLMCSCVHMYVCTEAREQLVCHSSGVTPPCFFEAGSLLAKLTHQLGWAGWPVNLRNHLTCFHLPSFSTAHNSGHYTVSSRESPTQEADLQDLNVYILEDPYKKYKIADIK